MTDGAVEPAAAGPAARVATSSPAACSASPPARPTYPGAAVLCTGGAVRTAAGDGPVSPARPASAVLARWPEVVAAADAAGRPARCRRGSVGPGHGHRRRAAARLRWVLDQDVPVLVDADGLTLLASRPALLGRRRRRTGPTVLTPHCRRVRPRVPGHRPRRPARRGPVGRRGVRRHRPAQGSPHGHRRPRRRGPRSTSPAASWLATAGAGDVLSGVVGSLLAAGLHR